MKHKEIIFIIALFIPELLKSLQGGLSLVYWILEFIRISVSVVYIANYLRYQQRSFIFNAVVLFHFVIILSSILNNASLATYKTIINVTIPNIGVICLLERLLLQKGIRGLEVIGYGLKILVLANLIFMLLYPNGLHIATVYNSENDSFRDVGSYFLSFKNRLILWFVPLMVILNIVGKKKEILFYNLIMIAQLIICNSVTSLFVFFIFHLLSIQKKINILNRISLKYIYIIIGLVFVAFIYYQVQTYFESFLEATLNKNVELQGRTFIWTISIDLIKEKWMLGYGNAGNGSIIDWNGYMWYSHNLILDVLIQGGIVGLLIMISVFLHLSNESHVHSDNRFSYYILRISIFVMLIEGMFESYLNYPQFFLLLAFGGILTLNTSLYKRSV